MADCGTKDCRLQWDWAESTEYLNA